MKDKPKKGTSFSRKLLISIPLLVIAAFVAFLLNNLHVFKPVHRIPTNAKCRAF